MPMKNPPHPGLSVRLNCLEPFGLSVTEGAKALGVSRTTLSRLVFASHQGPGGRVGRHGDPTFQGFRRNARYLDTHAGRLRFGASALA